MVFAAVHDARLPTEILLASLLLNTPVYRSAEITVPERVSVTAPIFEFVLMAHNSAPPFVDLYKAPL